MLVSVVVVTYNSSKYVIETLDSIYAQTYKDIELIISDDCSKDDTVEICKRWCSLHKERFESVDILESEINTGIAPNVNRGYSRAKGEWIKSLGGDDMLEPKCIELYLQFSNDHPEFHIIFSRAIPFGNNSKDVDNFYKLRDAREYFYELPTSECQYFDLLIREACMDGPSGFMQKTVFDAVDGFDESIPMYEDYPFYLKVTKNGFRIGYMGSRVTKYRLHEESIVRSSSKKMQLVFSQAAYDVFMKYRFESLKKLYAPYAWMMFLFYRGQKSQIKFIRLIFRLLRVSMRIFTHHKCMKVQNTDIVQRQLPLPLYKVYCDKYFDK